MIDKKKINIPRIIFLILTAIALVVIGKVIVTSRDPVQQDPWVMLTAGINIIFFLVQLLRAIYYHPFSFDMMFWVFNLFFFGYAPLLQHFVNKYNWGTVPSFKDVICANLVILLWSVIYTVTRDRAFWGKTPLGKLLKKAFGKLGLLFKKISFVQKISSFGKKNAEKIKTWKENNFKKLEKYARPNMKRIYLNILVLVSLLFFALDIYINGFVSQFTRAASESTFGSSSLDLILTHGGNNLLLFIASLHIIDCFRNRKFNIQTVIVSLCFLISCFPTGMSRNMMASFYAGLLIILFRFTKKGRWFSWVIIAGLTLAYPAIEIFRYAETLKNGNFLPTLAYIFRSTYLVGHYDAFSMFMTTFNYVKEFGITFGGQILGVLLFFVPRSIWPTKPSGTGHTIITKLDQYDFSNVSAPLPAEGYINFGFVGIILFAVIVGIVVQKLDKHYWNENNSEFRLVDFLYPHVMFMFFFMLRGDLLSSGAYTITQCIVGAVIYKLYTLSISLSKNKAA